MAVVCTILFPAIYPRPLHDLDLKGDITPIISWLWFKGGPLRKLACICVGRLVDAIYVRAHPATRETCRQLLWGFHTKATRLYAYDDAMRVSDAVISETKSRLRSF